MPGLDGIIGQAATVRLLARLLGRGRLPQTLLLEGVPGCGRRSLALALAQALLCHQPVRGDACGDCASCRACAAGSHPDLVQTAHDSVPGELLVDALREQVVEAAACSPLAGNRRAFLIYGAERLNGAAANALLKVLEEPTAGVAWFILTTASAAAVLPTIRSRSQLFRLRPLASEDIERVLLRQGLPPPEARMRAQQAEGGHRGLSGDDPMPPLEDLLLLVGGEPSSAAVTAVMERLPSRLGPSQEEAGLTLSGEQRRLLRQWLKAAANALRPALRLGPTEARQAARRVERIQQALADLGRNLQVRLVLESLADPNLAT